MYRPIPNIKYHTFLAGHYGDKILNSNHLFMFNYYDNKSIYIFGRKKKKWFSFFFSFCFLDCTPLVHSIFD